MTEPIICPHCGYENVQHHSICHKCGKKLEIQPSEGTKADVHKISNRPQEVIVKDIQMSFGSMIAFMVKWAIASIPALLILLVLGWIFSTFFFGILFHIFHR